MKPWIRFSSVSFMMVTLFFVCSCGAYNQPSQPKLNIDIDPLSIEYGQAESVFNFFESIANTTDSNVDVSAVIGLISLMDQDIGLIVDKAVAGKFPQGMDFVCDQAKCLGNAQGTATDIFLEDVDIGGFTNPELLLAADLEIKFRVLSPKTLEVCSIKGVKIKAAGVAANFDGALLVIGNDLVEEITVDVGLLGSYPNKKCNF